MKIKWVVDMNNYLKKNHLMKLKRFSNYSEEKQLEVAFGYELFEGKKNNINPTIINDNLVDSEITFDIENKLRDYINKTETITFFEKYNVYENITVNNIYDERYWSYIRAGIISEECNIYNISKHISCIEDLELLFSEIEIIKGVIERPYLMTSFDITENTVFYFEPQASAYIAHEIMGHCFEQDYFDMFTEKIFPKDSVIESNCKFTFMESNKYKENIFKSVDDMGVKVQPKKNILHNGEIVNLIDSKRINDNDGSFRDRMSCTVLESMESGYAFIPIGEYFHVYSICSGYVNFEESKIVLLVNLAEKVDGNTIEKITMLPIQMPLESVFKGIVGIEDNVSIFHNFCNKDRQIIDVFSGAPSIVMKGFELIK